MPTFKVKVSDEITYAREKVIEVEADDEEAACAKALDLVNEGDGDIFENMDEVQCDSAPWEAEVVTDE